MVLIAIILIIAAVPFFLASNYIDLSNDAIAFDWKESFHGAIWLDNFGWDTRPFRTPPWSLPFFLPVTALPFEVGWSLMTYFTTLMIVASVPRSRSTRLWITAIFLLLTAYPTLRNYADVNLEAYVIFGVLLSIYAYHKKLPFVLGIAVLIATIKPQAVFLLMIVLGVYILQTFQQREIFKFAGLVGAVFGITMLLWGQVWFGSLETVPGGISLSAGLDSLGLPLPLIIIAQVIIAIGTLAIAFRGNKQLSRMKVGLLIVGSVMAAPYANGLSTVSVLAIGVTALFIKRPLLGFFIFIVYSLPYTNALDMTIFDNPPFWMFALSLVWVLLAHEVYLEEIRPSKIEADN